MGIPQESNAVFYHPLDDLTEALRAQPWAGGASAKVGDVSFAQGQARASLSFGPVAQPPGTAFTNYVDASALRAPGGGDASKLVVVCSGPGAATVDISVGTVSGSSVTYGAANTPSTGFTGPRADIAAVSGTKFVVAHGNKAWVGAVSGTDVTLGAAAAISGASSGTADQFDLVRLAALSPTLVAAAYRSGTGVLVALGSVGATAVAWSPGVQALDFSGSAAMEIVALDALHVLVACLEVSSGEITLLAGEVSGGAVLFGPGAAISSMSASLRELALAATGASSAAVVYRSGALCARAVSVSGTSVSLGLPIAMTDPVASDCPTRQVGAQTWLSAAWDGTALAVACHIQFGAGDISGFCSGPSGDAVVYCLGIKDGLPAERGVAGFQDWSGDNPYGADVVAMSAGKLVWAGVAGNGTPLSKVADVSPPALALAATAPGAYPTAAAATRLAFSAWVRPGREMAPPGAAAVVEAPLNSPAQMTVSPIDSERAVVAYRNGTNGAWARVLTLSGSGVTVGPASPIFGGNCQWVSVAALGAALVAVYINGANNTVYNVGAVAGTDITWGAETPFEPYATGIINDGVRLLTAPPSTVVAAYLSGPSGGNPPLRVRAGVLSGADLTWGPQQELGVTGAWGLSASMMGPSRAVVSWRENWGTAPTRAVAADISGLAVSLGAPTPAAGGPLDGMELAQVSGIDSERFLIAFRDNKSPSGYREPDLYNAFAMVGTVSGGGITLEGRAQASGLNARTLALVGLPPPRQMLLHTWYSSTGNPDVALLATVGRVSGATALFGGEVAALAETTSLLSDRTVAAVVGQSCLVVYIGADGTELLARAFGVAAMPGPGYAEWESAGAYDFEVPAGVTSISCDVVGGGGGAWAGAPGSGVLSSASGGGGGYSSGAFAVTPGQHLAVTVGAGAAGNSGAPGGMSSVGAFLSATGGETPTSGLGSAGGGSGSGGSVNRSGGASGMFGGYGGAASGYATTGKVAVLDVGADGGSAVWPGGEAMAGGAKGTPHNGVSGYGGDGTPGQFGGGGGSGGNKGGGSGFSGNGGAGGPRGGGAGAAGATNDSPGQSPAAGGTGYVRISWVAALP